MASLRRFLLVATVYAVLFFGGSSASSPSRASVAPPQPGCHALQRSTSINLFCVPTGGLSNKCCDAVIGAAEGGGLVCLCHIASTPPIAVSGFTAGNLLEWYHDCGGTVPVDAYVAAQCGIGPSIQMSSPPSPTTLGSLPKEVPSFEMKSPSPPSTTSGSLPKEVPSFEMKSPPPLTTGSLPKEDKTLSIVIKVQTWHIILACCAIGLLLMFFGLWAFVNCSEAGPKRDKAKAMLDKLALFLPLLLQAALKEVEAQNMPHDEEPRNEESRE